MPFAREAEKAGRADAVKGGAAAERSEGTLDGVEHPARVDHRRDTGLRHVLVNDLRFVRSALPGFDTDGTRHHGNAGSYVSRGRHLPTMPTAPSQGAARIGPVGDAVKGWPRRVGAKPWLRSVRGTTHGPAFPPRYGFSSRAAPADPRSVLRACSTPFAG